MTTPRLILEVPMISEEVGECTIGEYLINLLAALWEERDGFSGKRPFGNSGWQFDIYAGLVRANLVKGTFDEDGYLWEFSNEEADRADRLVALAIAHLLP